MDKRKRNNESAWHYNTKIAISNNLERFGADYKLHKIEGATYFNTPRRSHKIVDVWAKDSSGNDVYIEIMKQGRLLSGLSGLMRVLRFQRASKGIVILDRIGYVSLKHRLRKAYSDYPELSRVKIYLAKANNKYEQIQVKYADHGFYVNGELIKSSEQLEKVLAA